MEEKKIPDKSTVAKNENSNNPPENEDNEEKREGWGNHIEFILSCVGYSVGLGNVWRFPYLAYKNGGGAFVIPYIISVVIAGLPLYFMELSLGQFSSLGPVGVFANLAPAFQGVGWGMAIVSLLVSLYYNMIIAWVLFYFVHSFRATLLWSHCNNDYNTPYCYSKFDEDKCKDIFNDTGARFFNRTCYNSSMIDELGLNESISQRHSAAEEFFESYMIERSPAFEETGTMSWKLVLCLGSAWILIFLCLFKGVKSTGKVVYFTATFPYVVLLILLIRGATLPGAADGLLFYVKPDMEQLKNWQVWKDAAEQVFFSLGPAFGGLMTMASYNKFNTNCKRDAIMISCIDTFSSTFAGCAIFSITGFMAHQLQKPIQEVVKSGMMLAFVAYPEAIVEMPVSPLWSILFFLMFITLGLDSEFASLETVTTAIVDSFPQLRKYKTFVIGGICMSMFLLGLPFCTQAGIYIFEILNSYAASYSVIIIALTECIVVSYVYGLRKFLDDVGMMLGSKPTYYWMITLGGVAPVYLVFIMVASFVMLEPVCWGEYELPASAQGLGIGISLLSVSCIPGFAIYRVIKCIRNKQPLRSLITPTLDWCPSEKREKRNAGTNEVIPDNWNIMTKI